MNLKQKAPLTTLLMILTILSLNQINGTSALPVGSMTEETARILQNHDKATGLNSTELIAMLDFVNETKYMSVTCGNITLTVLKRGPVHFELSNGIRFDDDTVYTDFEWVYIYYGVEFNRVKVTFADGSYSRLDDDRKTHPIGSIDIKIAKEQAIETAEQYISGFVAEYNLTIANVSAVLDSTWDETGALHPFWGVKILFNQNVSGVHVYVWAGSGLVHWSYRDNGSPFNVADYSSTATTSPASLATGGSTQPEASATDAGAASVSKGETGAGMETKQTNNPTTPRQSLSLTESVIIIAIVVTAVAVLLTLKSRANRQYRR